MKDLIKKLEEETKGLEEYQVINKRTREGLKEEIARKEQKMEFDSRLKDLINWLASCEEGIVKTDTMIAENKEKIKTLRSEEK